MKNVAKKVTGPLSWLNRMKPTPKTTMPTRMSAREPKRSVSQPCRGPRMPLSARDIENAADTIVLLQPNSSLSKTAYAPYE
jgi:hypothetical protein